MSLGGKKTTGSIDFESISIKLTVKAGCMDSSRELSFQLRHSWDI